MPNTFGSSFSTQFGVERDKESFGITNNITKNPSPLNMTKNLFSVFNGFLCSMVFHSLCQHIFITYFIYIYIYIYFS